MSKKGYGMVSRPLKIFSSRSNASRIQVSPSKRKRYEGACCGVGGVSMNPISTHRSHEYVAVPCMGQGVDLEAVYNGETPLS